ncbi:helix-turn-helix domain-containing protein [Ligilactobacillus ruminis]|uniref:helix-turn-helix domain-containing protein n=1 Tax=Ligilactobacillus ruminis TaxID=1623 RepID=UPI003F990930
MSIFENIKVIAADRGWTVKKVAEKAGIGEATIYRWKTTNPSTKSLEKVASVLGVRVTDLLNNEKEDADFQAIQRKARDLSSEERKKLLKLIEITFSKE